MLSLALVGAAVAVIVGAPVTFAAVLGWYGRNATRVLVSDPGVFAEVREPPPSRPDPTRDPAYQQYFFGQAVTDLRHVVRTGVVAVRELLARVHDWTVMKFWVPDRQQWLWPFALTVWLSLALGTLVAGLALVLHTAVNAVVIIVVQVLARLLTAVVRLVDSAVLRVRGITIKCPGCHRHVPYPAYACRNGACDARHRDVRPGRYGVLRRICRCGERLPTLLLLGSHRLPAFCPHCENVPLAESVGTAPELIVPFAGASAAGKTQLMVALLRALELRDGDIEFADGETKRRWPELRDTLDNQRPAPPTQKTPPRAYTVYVDGSGRRRRLVHFFDVAGELWNRSRSTGTLDYLDHGRSFVLVVNPLAIAGARLGVNGSAPFEEVDPTPVLERLTNELVRRGVDPRGCRLAVVVSRWDLVGPRTGLGLTPGPDVAEQVVGERLGLGGILGTAAVEFGSYRCFVVASVLRSRDHVDPTVDTVLDWILEGRSS